MKKYQIIGGQYFQVNYGETDSLLTAKRIATQHTEYWDNWQGWHKPKIFLSADCMDRDAHGEPCGPYRKPDAQPVAVWDDRKNRWIDTNERR